MAEPEHDPERLLRVQHIVAQLQQATEHCTVGDVQMALGNMVALLCLKIYPQDPDQVFLETQSVLLEIYGAIRAHVRAGKEPEVVSRSVN